MKNSPEQSLKVYGTDSAGISSIYVCNIGNEACRPGHCWGPGTRNEYLLHYVYAGKGIFCIHGNEYHLQAGDTFFARPGEFYYYRADEQEPWSYCWVAFEGSEVAALVLHTDFAKESVLHIDFGDELKECMLETYRQHGYTLTASLKMTAGLYKVMACLIEHAQSSASVFSRQESTLQDIVRYISSKIAYGESLETLSVRQIAKRSNMSESSLYRLFMSRMGIPPAKYLAKMRIAQACRLLTLSNESITSVAYSVGYPNGQCFAKNFKKVMGITPSEYIRLHAEK